MVHLDAAGYASLSYDELLHAIESGEGIHLKIDRPIAIDCLRSMLLVAALSSKGAALEISVPKGALDAATAASIQRSLLGPLIWREGTPRSGVYYPGAIDWETLAVCNEKYSFFVSHTSRLRSSHPDAFESDLVTMLRGAAIKLPRLFLAAITTIGFEATSNAEEYGYRTIESATDDSFRTVAAVVHPSAASLTPIAADYLRRYYDAGYTSRTPWLELLVVDAGVGIAYPRYEVLATAAAWSNRNVYQAEYPAEVVTLGLVLEQPTTTKGEWGRVVNRHTAYGQGTRLIKFHVASSRGCAILRSGRALATWYNPKATLTSGDLGKQPEYAISRSPQVLFQGTAWQLLLPLNPQLELGL